MNNVALNTIGFTLNGSLLTGVDYGGTMYLGSARVEDGYLTGALREFNLPNAVAPGEWPSAHEGVTTDEDPRHQGAGCCYGCDSFVCEDDICLSCSFDRSGLWLAPYGW